MLVFLSVPTHLIVRPSMVADSTRPCFAWSMNSEYDTASRVVWRASNCLTTVSTTKPMTSQIPTFFKRLFNVVLRAPGGDCQNYASNSRPYRPRALGDANFFKLSLTDDK